MYKFSPTYIFAFPLAAFFVSMILTRVFIRIGRLLGLMDEPDERRVHTTPVPRAGGLAIWVAFIALLWGIDALFPEIFVDRHGTKNIAWTISSAILIFVGFIDDRTGLKPLVKLGGQVIAAAVFCYVYYPGGFSIAGFDLPFAAALLIFVIWCVALINAFNLIDGLDGLCGGLVVVSLSMILVIAWSVGNWRDSAFIILMIGAVSGFLVYNLNPARIFLGDAGSMMLGFFIASSASNIAGERALIGSLMLPIAIAGIPLLDVILAIWRRSSRREMQKTTGEGKKGGVFSADKDHLHHRLLEMGLSQRKVAFILQLFAAVIAGLCILPLVAGGRAIVVTLFGFLIIGLFSINHFARIELTEAGNLIHIKIKSRTLGLSNRGLHFVYDVGALLAAGFLAMVVETNFGSRLDEQHVWSINYLLLFVVTGMVLLKVADIYRRIWSRPTFADFFVVGVVLSMSGLLASLVWSLNKEDVTWSDYRAGLLAGQISLWLVLLPRAIPVMLREFTVCMDRRRSGTRKENLSKKQVLVYGAGANGSHLIDFIMVGGSERISKFQIVGFLDEHPSFRGRLFRSFKVFGGLDQLEELSKKGRLDGLAVTISNLSDERWAELISETNAHGLNLYRWGADKDFRLVEEPSNESKS
jgi:UDP-N-acetylmuramyl pentapeptide phosphotransferase/UDP-N-acetylglucosamine-1-phosphate transferase